MPRWGQASRKSEGLALPVAADDQRLFEQHRR